MITLTHDQNNTRGIKIQSNPPQPSTEELHTWYGHRCGRAKCLELHSYRLYGEKTRSLESRIARKCKKNQCQRERRSTVI